MAPRDLVGARFPRFESGYESYYLRAADPSGGQGVWIRYTVHRRPGRPPTGSLWFTFFDARAKAPTALKLTLPDPRAGSDAWIRIGEATLGPGGTRGDIELPSGAGASWELSWTGADAFAHLPRGWMYDAPLPRTKPVSLHPEARVSGTLVIGDRVLQVDDWPGMVGHNWGSEHAERWIWLHATGFAGEQPGGPGERDWIDLVLARVRVGRWTTPWSGFGGLCLDRERHRIGGLSRTRATRVEEHPTHLAFTLPGNGLRMLGRIAAPASRFVGWVYADPEGGEHDVAHCSVADLEITVERPGREDRLLRASGVAAYEIGMREHDHGIEIAPFTDG